MGGKLWGLLVKIITLLDTIVVELMYTIKPAHVFNKMSDISLKKPQFFLKTIFCPT
jgi:hypothetical protein